MVKRNKSIKEKELNYNKEYLANKQRCKGIYKNLTPKNNIQAEIYHRIMGVESPKIEGRDK